MEIDIIYDSNEILAADGLSIAFPTILMFFLVTQVRNCEDESRILNDLHRITGLKCDRVEVKGEVKYNCKAPGFTLRLCPRANKNLHMPSGYPPGNL
ncbi:hypothetical protein T08_10650 [Trichinella sp. T8]|nr:hypothetical protein T08_10650 [Trichinella sp. T8]